MVLYGDHVDNEDARSYIVNSAQDSEKVHTETTPDSAGESAPSDRFTQTAGELRAA